MWTVDVLFPFLIPHLEQATKTLKIYRNTPNENLNISYLITFHIA